MRNIWANLNLRTGFILLALSLLFHFLGFTKPNSVVFDEVHFGKFTSAYCCTKERVFDIHPPHAKVIIAGIVAAFTDYDGSFGFEKIGLPYDGKLDIWAFRFIPALAGSLIPLMGFLIMLQLGGSYAASLLVGLFLIFENGLLLQSRIIALDSQLILGEVVALWGALKSIDSRRDLSGILWALLAGCAAGWSVGSKITGLVAVSLPGLVFIWAAFWEKKPRSVRPLRMAIWFCSAAVFTYLFGWFLHFYILEETGTGDRFYVVTGNLWTDFVEYQKVMFKRNSELRKTHTYGSKWYTWPFMFRSVFYWVKDGGRIYFLGNPFVWLGTSFVLVVAFGTGIFSRCSRLAVEMGEQLKKPRYWIPVVGFLNAYLPYMAVKRSLFLYHYLPPLVFGILLVGMWFDRIGLTSEGRLSRQRKSYFIILALGGLGFVLMSPLTFGFEMKAYTDYLFELFPSWR